MLILKINFYKFYKSFLGGAAVVENCDIKTVHFKCTLHILGLQSFDVRIFKQKEKN